MIHVQITSKRIIAYFLDSILISLLSAALAVSPLNPNYDKMVEYNLEYQETSKIILKAIEETEESTKAYDEYVRELSDVSMIYARKSCRLGIYNTLITVGVTIIYFGIVAYFLGGMTLGKKITGLKIVTSEDEKPRMLALIVRTLILYGLPFSIINLIGAFTLNTKSFFVVYSLMNSLSFILLIAVIFTTFIREDNRGLHDLIAKTKVEKGDK